MLDIFRSRDQSLEDISPELRSLNRKLSAEEETHRKAQEKIRAIRSNEVGHAPIPPGSPMERRKQPSGLCVPPLPPPPGGAGQISCAKGLLTGAEIAKP